MRTRSTNPRQPQTLVFPQAPTQSAQTKKQQKAKQKEPKPTSQGKEAEQIQKAPAKRKSLKAENKPQKKVKLDVEEEREEPLKLLKNKMKSNRFIDMDKDKVGEKELPSAEQLETLRDKALIKMMHRLIYVCKDDEVARLREEMDREKDYVIEEDVEFQEIKTNDGLKKFLGGFAKSCYLKFVPNKDGFQRLFERVPHVRGLKFSLNISRKKKDTEQQANFFDTCESTNESIVQGRSYIQAICLNFQFVGSYNHIHFSRINSACSAFKNVRDFSLTMSAFLLRAGHGQVIKQFMIDAGKNFPYLRKFHVNLQTSEYELFDIMNKMENEQSEHISEIKISFNHQSQKQVFNRYKDQNEDFTYDFIHLIDRGGLNAAELATASQEQTQYVLKRLGKFSTLQLRLILPPRSENNFSTTLDLITRVMAKKQPQSFLLQVDLKETKRFEFQYEASTEKVSVCFPTKEQQKSLTTGILKILKKLPQTVHHHNLQLGIVQGETPQIFSDDLISDLNEVFQSNNLRELEIQIMLKNYDFFQKVDEFKKISSILNRSCSNLKISIQNLDNLPGAPSESYQQTIVKAMEQLNQIVGVDKIDFELSEKFWGFINQGNAIRLFIPSLRSRIQVNPKILSLNVYFGHQSVVVNAMKKIQNQSIIQEKRLELRMMDDINRQRMKLMENAFSKHKINTRLIERTIDCLTK